MSQHDNAFYKPFVFVLGALVLLTVFLVIVANQLTPATDKFADPLVAQRLLETIEPVGRSRVKPAPVLAASVPSATLPANTAVSSPAPLKVRAVVATNCNGCHLRGLAGAAALDDTAAWAKLAEKGLDALTASVVNGKGAMPPRADTLLSDEQLRQAVEHLLALTKR